MITCLSIAYFVATVERRDNEALQQTPLVVGGHPWESKPLYAFSQEVARVGVAPRMSLRMAHMLSPGSHFILPDQTRYLQSTGEVLDLLLDFTTRIEPQDLWHELPLTQTSITASGRSLPAYYYLDLEDLPMREALPLALHIGKNVREETYLTPSIGLARNKFTATVAASQTRPSYARPVTHDSDFLSSRAIDFLPLEKEVTRRLHMLGIRTLGQFTNLPLSQLQEQFGPKIKPLYRMAQGCADIPLRPEPVEKEEQVVWRFEEPLVDRLVLGEILNRTAQTLAARLQEARLEGRELALSWELEDGSCGHCRHVFSRPTAEAALLEDVLQAQTTDLFTCGLASLSITVVELEPAAPRQLSLFALAASNRVNKTIRDLAAKYRETLFYRAVVADRQNILPERRFALQEYAVDQAMV